MFDFLTAYRLTKHFSFENNKRVGGDLQDLHFFSWLISTVFNRKQGHENANTADQIKS